MRAWPWARHGVSGPGAASAVAEAMPYWRLSGFYFFYFASLGALVFYWSVYLDSLGFSREETGELLAILSATKLVAPLVWGWIADHTGHRMTIVRSGALAAALTFAGVYWVSSYWGLALVMAAFSFFWNAVLPQFEATTFSHLGEQVHRYSSIRLWGSIGFIVVVWAVGWGIDRWSIAILPTVVLVLFAGIWLSSLLAPESAAAHLRLDHEPLARVLRRPQVAGLLAVCFLMQASHGPYYAFYVPYLQSHGYSAGLAGGLIALGVVAEVGVFLIMHRWLARFGMWRLLLAALLLAVVRWLLTAWFADSLAVTAAAQTLHAATFGVYHAAAIQLIHTYFTGRHQGKGQALYSSLSFGAGGAAGALYAGYAWELAGGPVMYYIAAALAGVGALVAWRMAHHQNGVR